MRRSPKMLRVRRLHRRRPSLRLGMKVNKYLLQILSIHIPPEVGRRKMIKNIFQPLLRRL